MTASPAKTALLCALLAGLTVPAMAQSGQGTALPGKPDNAGIDDPRDASFLPTPLVPMDETPAAATTTGAATALPSTTTFVATGSALPSTTSATPETATGSARPSSATDTVPMPKTFDASQVSTPNAITVTTTAAVPTTLPSDIVGKPVETTALQAIGADTVGTLRAANGGLGADMWKGTPRALIDKVMSGLTLPTSSPTLNDLAQRLLLTTADMPEDKADNLSSVAMRAEKLVMLGDAASAWSLIQLAKAEQIGEPAYLLVTQNALAGAAAKDVCTRVPEMLKTHTTAPWQEAMVTCQLQNGDTKTAQLTLDVLQSQDQKDSTFFELAEHNIIGASKSLPRPLTPLKPLDMALLRMMDYPLPSELFSKPDAALIISLLQSKSRSETSRLALAERAAARGLIPTTLLARVYSDITFDGAARSFPLASEETGARLRALLYQAILNEKSLKSRFDEAIKYMNSLDAAGLNGVAMPLLAETLGPTQPNVDVVLQTPSIARIYILAGKNSEATPWFAYAQKAGGAPAVVIGTREAWPYAVLAGMVPDADFTKDFGPWLEFALKDSDRVRQEQIGGLLLLFDAVGYAVPDSTWAQTINIPNGGRKIVPTPTLAVERLQAAGAAKRRGEAILMALAAAANDPVNLPLITSVTAVRALRETGLTDDARRLAREAAVQLLVVPADDHP